MMKFLFTLLGMLLGMLCVAQHPEETEVKKTIQLFFEGMRNADTLLLRNTLQEKAILQTIVQGKDGNVMVRNEDINAFIASIGKPHTEIYDERIQFETIKIDASLASVWTPYQFYVGKQFSHCGVNSFQLVKTNGQWKIQYIIDTRRKTGCD